MRAHPHNFLLQLGNAGIQLVTGISVEQFAAKQAGSVSARSRTIVIFHQYATSDSGGLLSTGLMASACGIGDGTRQGAMTMKTLPESMLAAGFDAPGGPDVLRLETCPLPAPGPGEVLVRVAFAGVNRPDVIQRQGFYPPPPGASPIPGLEISGTIVALGEGAEPALLGQLVCALVAGGGYAEYCTAHAEHCLPVPEGLPLAEAAAMPETLFTVWHNVFERGWARDGETLLVHGGTSGIGTMAILLGRAFGLTVIVTCGSAEKCARALEIGAHHAIDYRAQDFVAEVARITGGHGAHLVLDMVGGDYVARNLRCLGEDGRHVSIAVLGGATAELNMAVIMVRRYTLTGSTLRPRSAGFKALLAQEIEANAWPLFVSGELRPVMDRIFPLGQAAAAHTRMEAGDHVGKIVLSVGGG